MRKGTTLGQYKAAREERRRELEKLATVVALIDAEHPESEETANSIVDSELRRLEREMGESLDEIAWGGQ
jgi:hypothetical protein